MSALYVSGLRSKTNSGLVEVGEGTARDTTDAIDLTIDTGDTLELDVSTTGDGGLDASVQNSTAYALYILKRPGDDPVLMGSTSFSAPNAGGTFKYRRIGSFATGPSGNVVPFVQYGTSNDRQNDYTGPDALLRVVNDGNPTSFETVDCRPLLNEANEKAFVRVIPSGGWVTVRAESGSTEYSTDTPETFPIGTPNEAWRIDFKVDVASTTTDLLITGMSEVI